MAVSEHISKKGFGKYELRNDTYVKDTLYGQYTVGEHFW